jgi:hypothetical protein
MYKRLFIYSILIYSIFGGCKPSVKSPLIGEWYAKYSDTGEVINYFTKIVIKSDSIFLKDFNLIEYKVKYQLDSNKVVIGDTAYPFEFIDDSTIKVFDFFFMKKTEWSFDGFGQYIPNNITLDLPFYLPRKTVKNKSTKNKEHINDIVIGVGELREPVLWQGGENMRLAELFTYLEVYHLPREKIRSANLYIDKNTPMSFIDSVFKILDASEIRKIKLFLGNEERDRFYLSNYVSSFIPPTPFPKYNPLDKNLLKTYTGEPNNRPQIIDISDGGLLISNNKVDSSQLNEMLVEGILSDNDYKPGIILLYHSLTTYDRFMKEMVRVSNIYNDLWNTESLRIYNKGYQNLSVVQRKTIINQIPKKFRFISYSEYQKLKEMSLQER